MLYRLHNNFFIVGLLTLGLLAILSKGRALCMVTPVTVFAFTTQIALILYHLRGESSAYSEKSLFAAVLIYTLLLAGLIEAVAHYYDGGNYLFEDPDGQFYYEEGIKAQSMGALGNALRILTTCEFDDWGALLVSNFLMAIAPTPYAMNVLHILTGVLSAVLLFRIGRMLMPDAYAFVAAMGYATSSFLILFHCTYLKESFFTFLVICTMYFFYKSVLGGERPALIGAAFFLLSIVFYRPAVVAFLLLGFVTYYAVTQRGTALSFFLYIAIVGGLVLSMAFMQSQVDAYTEGGNAEEMLAENGSANYSGGFNYFVGWFAAFFGPFPSLFPTGEGIPTNLIFYGAGLTYKLFLVIPLILGVFWTVKSIDVRIIPIVAFMVVEMAASAYVLASFELRKVMLHIPFTFVVALYGLYQLEQRDISIHRRHLMELIGYGFAIGVLLLWNVIRVKG